MSNYEIDFFAWCQTADHDKIWGWAHVGDDATLYNFYGKRGSKFSFKRYGDLRSLELMAAKKLKAGRPTGTYAEVPIGDIGTIVPGFHEEFGHQLTLAKLFDNFHGERMNLLD